MRKHGRLCTIGDCRKGEVAKGMCSMHYMRNREHGSPLALKSTEPGSVPAFLESIPMSGEGCLTWPFGQNGAGYAQISVNRKRQLVSRIVCERVNGPPPSPDHMAAHECGKGHEGCIAPWHLNWKTPAENCADMERHGTKLIGEQHATAKLTEKDVILIRELARSKSHQRIADDFGVCQTLISGIVRRVRWIHVP